MSGHCFAQFRRKYNMCVKTQIEDWYSGRIVVERPQPTQCSISRQGRKWGSWGARNPPFCKLFKANNLQQVAKMT